MSSIGRTIWLISTVTLALWCFPFGAYADTTIKLSYVVETQRIAPNPNSGPAYATHSLTIVLSGSNHIEEMYEGGGKHPLSSQRSETLGRLSADGRVQFRVVDAHSIEMIRDFETYVNVITVLVDGTSCRMTLNATLKPGKAAFESFSQELGVPATYKYFKLARSTCEISG